MRDELSDTLKQKNYNLIPIDEEKKRSEYGTDERRSEIYELYMSGEMKNVNKTELADDYGVSRKQLYKDLNIIRLWVRENPEAGLVEDSTQKLNEAIEKLLEKGEEYKAGKLISTRLDFLQEAGLIEKQADKVEVEEKQVREIEFNEVNTKEEE